MADCFKCLRLVTVLSLVCFLCCEAIGQHRSPQRYRVDVVNGPSFARVTIALHPAAPATETTQFKVVLRQSDFRSPKRVVTKAVTIPKGSTSADCEIYFHEGSYAAAGGNRLHIEQDGNNRFDTRRDLLELPLRSSTDLQEPQILVVSSNISTGLTQTWFGGKSKRQQGAGSVVNGTDPLPALEAMSDFLSEQLPNAVQTPSRMNMFQAIPRLHGLPLSQLPRNWLGLANTKMLLISLTDLEIACESEDTCTALRDWVTVGGKLVVHSCSRSELRNSPERIRRLLIAETSRDSYSPASPDWLLPTQKILDFELYITRRQRYYGVTPSDAISIGEERTGFSIQRQIKAVDEFGDGDEFVIQPFNRGHTIAVFDDMTQWKNSQWRGLFNSVAALPNHLLREIGADNREQTEVPGFRIPNVGDPPVRAFQVLVSIFVVLVGPVFYYVLSKSGKMHLLYFLAPFLSLLACVGIVTFALATEGLTTVGRVHTVTYLDHRLNSAVQHSRYVFYSPSVPAALEFNDQTLALDSRRSSPISYYHFRDDSIYMSGGGMMARTPFQVAATDGFECDQRLVANVNPGDNSISVVNRFEGRVKYAAIHHPQGWFVVTELASAESRKLTPASFADVQKRLEKLVELGAPFDGERLSNWTLEQNVIASGAADDLILRIGNSKLRQSSLPAGSYIAIIDANLSGASPLKGTDFDDREFHIVVGKW